MTVHNYSVEIDNWIDEANPVTNHGNDTALWMRYDDGGKDPDYERNIIMRFQNTGAANGHCQDAWLVVRVLETWGTPTGKVVSVRPISYWVGGDNTDWTELHSCWTYKLYDGRWRVWLFAPPGGVGGGAPPAPTSTGTHVFRTATAQYKYIKQLVDKYRDNNSGDTHFLLGQNTGSEDWGFSIAARDYATVAYRPVLVICEAGTNRRRHC